MGPTTAFLTGLAVTFAVALAIVVYMRRHLRRLLTDLCGTQERADFWTAFCNVLLVLVPLIGALTHIPSAESRQSPILDISIQLRAALLGLVVALVMVGLILSSFIRRASK